MRMINRVDQELRKPLEDYLKLSSGDLKIEEIPKIRKVVDQISTAMKAQAPEVPGVSVQDKQISGPPGGCDLRIRVYRPSDIHGKLPALLWIHGGGYVLGSIDQDDPSSKHMAVACECVVVSVDYRLAPENPFPAPLEDCYAALKWMHDQGGELGIDCARIAVGGASAGGGLGAALALLARDRMEMRIAFQLLIYPMIDDSNIAPADETILDTYVWSRENNRVGWKSYLGCEPGSDGISPYAAAFRALDLSGLPPAYIAVGDLDLFLSENIEYAQRILRAGIPVELHVYPGAFHGFYNFFPRAQISRRFTSDLEEALKRALHRDSRAWNPGRG
jgi:acetyl esterase/lipase